MKKFSANGKKPGLKGKKLVGIKGLHDKIERCTDELDRLTAEYGDLEADTFQSQASKKKLNSLYGESENKEYRTIIASSMADELLRSDSLYERKRQLRSKINRLEKTKESLKRKFKAIMSIILTGVVIVTAGIAKLVTDIAKKVKAENAANVVAIVQEYYGENPVFNGETSKGRTVIEMPNGETREFGPEGENGASTVINPQDLDNDALLALTKMKIATLIRNATGEEISAESIRIWNADTYLSSSSSLRDISVTAGGKRYVYRAYSSDGLIGGPEVQEDSMSQIPGMYETVSELFSRGYRSKNTPGKGTSLGERRLIGDLAEGVEQGPEDPDM